MKQFEITYFFGPAERCVVKEEVIADMAKAGITVAQLLWYRPETNKQVLKLLKKYGMRASIFEWRITEASHIGTQEAIEKAVREVVEDYKEFDNIEGYEIWDEPKVEQFRTVAMFVEAFRRYAPEQETVVNLYPNYAPVQALGAEDYDTYLRKFVEIVKPDFLSYDHYPFQGRNLPGALGEIADIEDEKERLIRIAAKREWNRDEFFTNLEAVRKVGQEHKIPQMMIAQLTEHGTYRNLTLPEIRWQVNMCLAYGFKRISYFTYGLPESDMDVWMWDNSVIGPNGEKYPHYYDVQTVNQEVYEIGTCLFDATVEAVFHMDTDQESGIAFRGYRAMKKLEGGKGVVGFFDNGYVYLVNYDFVNEATYSMEAETELSVYEDGQFRVVGNTHTLKIPAGGAALLKM